jgi:hypothetical protein
MKQLKLLAKLWQRAKPQTAAAFARIGPQTLHDVAAFARCAGTIHRMNAGFLASRRPAQPIRPAALPG